MEHPPRHVLFEVVPLASVKVFADVLVALVDLGSDHPVENVDHDGVRQQADGLAVVEALYDGDDILSVDPGR
jgi:hypothetical protein